MSDLAAALMASARLTMLQLLAKAPEYQLNNLVIGLGLDGRGVRLTGDQVRAELAWLESLRLVKLLDVGGNITVAELSERGHDVARGRLVVSGIERPTPGA